MRSFNDYAIAAFLAAEFAPQTTHKGRLLDLGCGMRPYAQLYAGRVEHCVAGDFEARTSGLDVRLDAQALPFPEKSFDWVLFSEVVEHLPDSRQAIAEIARVLRPGGTLLITWPFMHMMHEVPNDYTRYTEFGMARLLEANGMEIEVLVRRGGALALVWSLLEFFVEGALELLARTRLVGQGFRFLKKPILWLAFELPYRMYFAFALNRGLCHCVRPGDELRGGRGKMAHWTLGYCARARRRVNE